MTKTFTASTSDHQVGTLTYMGGNGASIVISSEPVLGKPGISRFTLRAATSAEIAMHEAACAERRAATNALYEASEAAYGRMGHNRTTAAASAAVDEATARMVAANAAMVIA